ncbi:ATPase involved in DNA repair/chromosome segregation, partial [Giardia duodenalis]
VQRSVYWPPCVPGSEWQTALMYAAEANAADMCKVLVAAEAGPVRKDGKTALILAAMADARDAALVLAACEKEAGQRDTNGFTALMGAVQHRNTDLARLLLRREAGVQRGAAATHIAASSKCCPGRDAVSL